jgi:hypothetical protein
MIGNSYWSQGAAGTNSGATATQAADSTRQWIVTSLSGHTDANSLLQITDGTNVLFEGRIDISKKGFHFNYTGLVIPIGQGNAAEGKIISSTNDCFVAICGHSAP